MSKLLSGALMVILGGLVVVSSAIMNRFFGIVGVLLFLGMTAAIVGLVLWLQGGLGGGSSSGGGQQRAPGRQSKGARSGRDR